MDFSNKKICVLGLSKSGIAAAKQLALAGASCLISEKREKTEEDDALIEQLKELGIEVEMGEHKKETITQSDFIITSPGIPPKADVFNLAKVKAIPVLSEIDVAYLLTKTPFLAITGTNGKTTTTKLLAEIIQKSGRKTQACGNIGLPPCDLLQEELDYFTLEISSFQAATSQYFMPYAACFLNYSPDHITWHGSEEEYFDAKAQLFTGVNAAEWAVLNAKDSKVISLKDECEENIFTFGKEDENNCVYIEDDIIKYKNEDGEIEDIIPVAEVSLIGEHNLENIMCAVSMAKIIGVENEPIAEVLATFAPPEHRLEFVAEVGGKKYYNDSKATNTDAAIKAINAFEGKKTVLIAGGRDKMTPLDDFVAAIKENIDYVILLGEATERFEGALKKAGYKNIDRADGFTAAIDMASQKDVDNVLLAPACASFDMFKSFEERGDVFKEYVREKLQ
ncbi:MAG: UDP-N-acetylmuramoyl-L-alanine--D-glutamate ligase [Candidatus Gastranaerophilales bacterium]|nr:UDP-N-acetylmuramoyl-L-alanine--D-glutamate ligase [Candidatus Gastranaerophilales bacterium]